MNIDAILAYGYDLGGDDDGWNIREVDDLGYLRDDWRLVTPHGLTLAAKLDHSDRPGTDVELCHPNLLIENHAERILAGHNLDKLITLVQCGHLEFPRWLLACHVVRVRYSVVRELDTHRSGHLREQCDVRLDAALHALGITPIRPKATWLLTGFSNHM